MTLVLFVSSFSVQVVSLIWSAWNQKCLRFLRCWECLHYLVQKIQNLKSQIFLSIMSAFKGLDFGLYKIWRFLVRGIQLPLLPFCVLADSKYSWIQTSNSVFPAVDSSHLCSVISSSTWCLPRRVPFCDWTEFFVLRSWGPTHPLCQLLHYSLTLHFDISSQ